MFWQEAESIKGLIRERSKKSLYSFAKHVCGYSLLERNTHGPICRALEHPHPRKLIVTPRGSFKSSLCVVSYALWLLINDPNKRILVSSELFTNSKNFIREIKGILASKPFSVPFGDWTGPVWAESEIIIKPRKRNLKEASITAAGVGTQKVGQHFDAIILDDCNSDKNSNTKDGAKKVVDYYRYLLSILEPDGIVAVIGTRYSENDLIGHIIANECQIEEIDRDLGPHNKEILSGYSKEV